MRTFVRKPGTGNGILFWVRSFHEPNRWLIGEDNGKVTTQDNTDNFHPNGWEPSLEMFYLFEDG